MRIAIDSRSVNLHSGTGIGTYTSNLVSEILNIDTKTDFSLIWTGTIPSNFRKDNTKFIHSSGRNGRFFENYFIPNKLINNIDLYHIPQNGMGFPFDYNLNTVVTIHDLIPYTMPETVGTGYLNRFLRDMPRIIENSKGILTVSEFSKRDILRFFKGYPEDKIFVTPLATNKEYRPLDKNLSRSIINKTFNFNTPYVLYIGGFSSRKNVHSLIDAFLNIESSLKNKVKLLIVGSLKDEGEVLYNYVKEKNKLDSIIFTGFIDNNLLPTLYSGAEVFAYPSLYEGFGLPPLEAMSCGTSVLTSNITSIPEVTQDAAMLIDPNNLNSISDGLFSLLDNESLRLQLSANGLNKAKEFSWKNTANLTLRAYDILINSL